MTLKLGMQHWSSGPTKFVQLWPLVDLNLFQVKVKFGHLGFRMKKKKPNSVFFQILL